MLRAIFWLLVTIILCNLIGVGFGFYALYLMSGLWFLIGLGVYVVIIVACSLLIWKFLDKLKVDLNEFVSNLKAFVADTVEKIKNLSVKDIMKIVLKLLKK